ncbi:histone acetyltransferase [Malassezia cuniculi]|uniref:Histone acetyltransferase type B catalytic subunit n=1 Tax=Malassezia cuniculi TaxID=948313 RepID=A0AAF0J7I5_9BASI|nr:histone acetyltransferase [Malassezia cuniculi]
MASKWTADANAATCLRLVGAPAPADGVFHPEFTYPIFGDAESIFGYTGLEINLSFASGSLQPSLNVTYDTKNTLTSAKIDDVEGTLHEFLPERLVNESELADIAAKEAGTFCPPGEIVARYTHAPRAARGLFSRAPREREYVIFHATWDTPRFREWHDAARIFTLFFIEGASYIDADETNWEFYLLYEREDTPSGDAWHFVGYTSLYRFWCWPDSVRLRLSQFVVLPPYQKQGHGSRLYATVYDRMLADPQVCEFAVEDPSEAFDRLRDSADLRRLTQPDGIGRSAALDGKLRAPLDRTWSKDMRKKLKMAPRQWARILEMLQLTMLRDDAEQLRAYRLQVKGRLYRVNKEILSQLPRTQRLEKLHETFLAVVDEYAEITGAAVPEALLVAPPPSEGVELPPVATRLAHAVIEHGADGAADDDDDNDDDDNEQRRKSRRIA